MIKSFVKMCLPVFLFFILFLFLIFSVISGIDDGADNQSETDDSRGLYTSATGEEIVAYARQFLGNPYVWGGTSLTNGADCSGFVQSVFAHFGISLPRTASQQADVGEAVASLADLVTGDIITYHSITSPSGWHVGIYDGEGKIVEAKGSKYGITNDRPANHGTIFSMRRLVTDVVPSGGDNVGGEKGDFLGMFRLTGYCNCTICCGKWAGGATASGVMPTPHRTVAISKTTAVNLGLKFGDKLLIINNGVAYTYVYEDGGDSNMAGNNWIDIYVGNHAECYAAYCNTSGYTAEVYRLN